MATVDEMKAEMAEIEKHMTTPGGGACDWQLYFGDCKECERWYELDDLVIAATNSRESDIVD